MKTLATRLLIALAVAVPLSTVAVTLAPTSSQAAIIDRIVARINDEIVTLHELRQAATPYLLQQGRNPALLKDASRRDAILKEVLDDLVDRKLIVQEAAKLDLRVTDAEVDQWLAYTRQQQQLSEADFKAMISQYGIDYATYREIIRENLLKIRLVNTRVGSQVQISDSEVNAAYKKRFGASADVERVVQVRHIMVQPASNAPEDVAAARQKIESLRERVQRGEDFNAIARAESQGPTASRGGELGSFRRGELDPSFEEVAFELEKGEVSEIFDNRFGFHILQVTDVKEEASASVEQKKAQIRAELQQEAMERQLDIYVQSLRNRSFVETKL